MRATDLDLRELLSYDPEGGGIIRFGEQRVLLFDAVALGLLRKELIQTLGLAGARGVLCRVGYAHGWRTAERFKTEFPWDDEREWQMAGPRLHTLQGFVVTELEGGSDGLHAPGWAVWHDSYEAEQHLLHLGQAEDPVCWTLCGFASGYSSFVLGKEIYCVEERCRGKGDAVCQVVGRTKEQWGDALASLLPFYENTGLDATLAHVTRELERVERRLRVRRHELGAEASESLGGLVARSEAMQKVVALARRVAKVDSTVLVTGESGVGKERIARLVHGESHRMAGPFIALNCGAVPESLLESELFGHAKGAFTGAAQDRPGLFEAANGGTLLLDEIGEVPPAMQVKLLRVLQEREVRRVGETRSRPIDVRVLAATNRDLTAEVAAGRFRRDLLYRLRVIEIRVPALRERREDILPLARAFLVSAGERTRRSVEGLTARAADRLLRYGWPGNVRELENAIEHAAVLATGSDVDVEDLPDELALSTTMSFVPGDARSLADVERDYILAVLRANDGNKVRTADHLGIGTATLYRKLKEYESPTGEP